MAEDPTSGTASSGAASSGAASSGAASSGTASSEGASSGGASSEGAGSGGTDLGRRIAEQRDAAHLTADDVAERAGMSPQYLRYLESSPEANPTPATLTRLAVALDIMPGVLEGAGLNLPPGQQSAAKNATLFELTVPQCRELIAAGGVGRFLFVQAGRGPMAIPVNFRMDGADVIFRTSGGSAIADGIHQHAVSFDVDQLDEALGEGWSVVLTGTAGVITDGAEKSRVQALAIEPWAGGDRDVYVRLSPSQITGRRIRVSG
jgi:transcriptional regulator with XRE-family HTH domain